MVNIVLGLNGLLVRF